MTFPSLAALLARLHDLGSTQVFAKLLAENDNSKQQIYLGGSFEVLRLLPFYNVRTDATVARANFKAALNLWWIDANGQTGKAAGAQLILYPDYPEVRLSGFLRGCPIAPANLLRPIPRNLRQHNNGPDGRALFFGVTEDRIVFAYVAAAGSTVSRTLQERQRRNEFEGAGVFWIITAPAAQQPRDALLAMLRRIHRHGWYDSCKLGSDRVAKPYSARNGAGYTLEALFGIRPNGDTAPDYLGWELKTYRSGKVTLMTPEPDIGFYGINGVEAFVRRYGRAIGGDVIYFTGTHRANLRCVTSGHMLTIRGFDRGAERIVDVTGGIDLLGARNELVAGWSFGRLIEHWGRKHAFAAYVPYDRRDGAPPKYRFNSPVLLGEHTDFALYLGALLAGHIVYDPGSKIEAASTRRARVKARSQFRIPIRYLPTLYRQFQAMPL